MDIWRDVLLGVRRRLEPKTGPPANRSSSESEEEEDMGGMEREMRAECSARWKSRRRERRVKSAWRSNRGSGVEDGVD